MPASVGQFVIYESDRLILKKPQVLGKSAFARQLRPIKDETFIPLPEDANNDWIYCWNALLQPFLSTMHKLPPNYHDIFQLNEPVKETTGFSENLIRDHFNYFYKPQLDILKAMKKFGRHVVVLEPNRPNPFPCEAAFYHKVTRIEQEVIQNELKQMDIPFIDLPQEMVDENGFNKEAYRMVKDEPDYAHANALGCQTIGQRLIDFLEEHFYFDGEDGPLSYRSAMKG
jgi:hypothetical protein